MSLIKDAESDGCVKDEFSPEEIKKGALDNLNKKEPTYEEYRHLFVNDDQFQLFRMLPGGAEVKHKILTESLNK